MEQKRFKKNDNGFICAVCGHEVQPLKYSSRDHCPKCLSSLHVDIMPGDRANSCRGILRPVQVLPDPKKDYIIVYKCEKCGESVRCRAATQGDSPDDMSLIIKMTNAEWKS
jgi:DNA-directed RNA polymerase subunit RPC12/RpoP